MRSLSFSILASVLFASAAQASPQLSPVGIYDTGLGDGASEIVDVRADGLAVLTLADSEVPGVDVLDLSDPSNVVQLRRINLADTSRGLNFVSIHPFRNYFLVAQGDASPATEGKRGVVSAYRLSDGLFLGAAEVGIQPDSIKIAPNGRFAVVANEAEGADQGDNGGPGSISVIDLRLFSAARPNLPLRVTNIALSSQAGVPGFTTDRTDDIARLPIDNTPDTLEPETVSFSKDSQYAWISLQENNGVVQLKLADGSLTYLGLGQTTHAADLKNDGVYNPVETLTAFREPDGLALTPDDRYFVTADEGDTRNASGSGAVRGGRTVSIFDAQTGTVLGDTAGQLDDAAAAIGLYPDSRSPRGGSEPEGLDVSRFKNYTLAAVGLERADAVALVDISNPSQPAVISLVSATINGVAGVGPEGVKFFKQGDRLFVLSANEVSGTLSVFEVTP
jgi:hypothetical protein